MKYRSLFTPLHGEARELKRQCLIWSANHEHAVTSIDDDIHPQAKCVWLEFEGINVIHAYEKHWKTGEWKLVERKKGNIPLVNNNPFKPDSESVFPVNKRCINRPQCLW